jgi:hypothetical protein
MHGGGRCRHAGARYVVVTDVNPYRLELAKSAGRHPGRGRPGDEPRRRAEGAGHEGGLRRGPGDVRQPRRLPRHALANMCHGGKIALLGILPEETDAIDWNKVVFNMLTIKGIYGREMYETWYKMTSCSRAGLDISPVITHRFHYTEFERASRSCFRPIRQGDPELGLMNLSCTEDFKSPEPASELDAIRGYPARASTRTSGSSPRPRAPHRGLADGRGAQPVRQQLPGPGQPPRGHRRRPRGLDRWGYGLSSVRFICGTQDCTRSWRQRLSASFSAPRTPSSTVLLLRCQWRPLRDPARARGRGHQRRPEPRQHHRRHPAVQGHALPLRQVTTWPTWKRSSRPDRRLPLQHDRHRRRLLHGRHIAALKAICDLADKYDALVMVDDSHAVGFMGPNGRGTHEHCGVMGRVDIITGTLGKALGGASGGYTSGRKEIIDLAAPALAAVSVFQHAGPA